MFGRKKKVAKVVEAEPESEPVPEPPKPTPEPQKEGKVVTIIAAQLAENGEVITTLRGSSMGEVGEILED